MKSFIKQFIATMQGDNAAVVAEKTKRQAISALKSQIAMLEGSTVDLEENLSTAKDQLSLASINNGTMISDRNEYVQNLIVSKNNIIECELKLKNHNDKISFLKEQLEFVEAAE